ncbi:MAG: acyl-CoA thioesterase/bile acid-CoA:amino acid N-acyltransferase family protein, partial [Gaiellaceae bacterium]
MVRRQGLLVVAVVLLTACAHAKPRLTATPRTSLVDQPVSIQVSGVRPGALVRISVDEDGWAGSGVFRADRHGRVSPARQASLRGTYTGRAPMGLFWSMASGFGVGPYFGGTVRVTATVRGNVLGRTTLTRLGKAKGVEAMPLAVKDEGFLGRYYRPAPAMNRHIPVLLIGGSEGGLSMTGEAALLASHGYPALDVAYFGAYGLPRNLRRIPLEYFVRAARWLDRRAGVDGHRLVVYGVSRGTEAAMLLAAHFPKLFAGVVVLSPAARVNPAFVRGALGPHGAAWTIGGRAIDPGSEFPFRSIHARVFVTAGLEDNLFLSYTALLKIQSMLPRGRVVATIYQHAGHFVDTAIPYLPFDDAYYNEALGVTETLGGTSAGESAARADEWPRILRFIGSTRPGGGGPPGGGGQPHQPAAPPRAGHGPGGGGH